jgi:Na+/proline symporter
MFWGVFACVFAVFAADLGSLIEVVNIVGSYFYGSILGVFMLAIGVRRANGWGASVGLVSGMLTVALVSHYTPIVFLWLNIVGAFTVVAVGYAVSLLMARPGTPGSA